MLLINTKSTFPIKPALGVLIFCCLSLRLFGQYSDEILLYGLEYKNNGNEEKTFDGKGNLTHLSGYVTPRLLVYKPQNPCGTGIIICPGGGYARLNVENTRFIADRLTKMGITVFVLIYRLPVNDSSARKSVAALQDVQAAFRIVRRRAKEWRLSDGKLGLWGSSAGGHLAAMAATHYSTSYVLGADTAGLRPDFLILAWPVISFRQDIAHNGSVKNLLGNNITEEQRTGYSSDEWVNIKTPPTFLVHASDDPTVQAANSIRFYEALKKAEVPAELHIYERGGHGFGLAPDVQDSWIGQLELWLRRRNFIK